MNFTFGIITSEKTQQYMGQILSSIYNLKIPDYEVVVVGGTPIENVKHIPFDDSPKIALKKNMIVNVSTKENIVFLHDYFAFDSEWYKGFLGFGNDWDVCMNRILNIDGMRFRDWCSWDDKPNMTINGHRGLLAPYNYTNYDRMYISGGYWVAKRKVMIDNPLNSHLEWADCEDLEWSKRVIRKGYRYRMNTNSICYVVKPYKNTVFEPYPE